MGSLVLAGATSGSTTITPSATGTYTITLPAETGTIQTSGAGFTTNGVAYASSTSALTTGSALTFDGTKLGVGTTSPNANLQVTSTTFPVLKVADNLGGGALALGDSTTNNNYVGIWRGAANSISGGGFLNIQGNNIAFMPTDATFGSASEAMRLDSSGNLLVGTTSQTGTVSRVAIKFDSNNFTGLTITASASGSAGQVSFRNSANTEQGYISTTGSGSTSYVTSSDYRLKENIAPMTGALAKVAQLKPVTYTWKQDGSDGQGFIAHELQAVVPECVTREKDEVDADGNPRYQGIDTSFLVATLTSALQEAHGLIKDLQTRVIALETK